ncbi:alpha/beta hydrolase [Leifsonia sp. ku-ls]|nr:alpha/beta hydrolase [Leifsonia sp. ku-ls]
MSGSPAPALLGTALLATPDDYADYWASALDDARRHPLDLRRAPVDTGLTEVDVFDVSFAGADGRRVSGWLRLPRHRAGALPAVVHFNGYGAGRLDPLDDLTWPVAGFAQLVMNTHAQGGASTGHLLDGIDDPHRSYYRGVFVDAARAVDALRALDEVDGDRIAAIGNSQGGGIALGVGALQPGLVAVLAQAPFLTAAPLGLRLAANGPWLELRAYLEEHPDRVDAVARTLAYVDGVTSARHATAPGWISDGLADDICPPETARAAAEAYTGAVTLREWPGAGHEAGATADRRGALAVLRERFAAGSAA